MLEWFEDHPDASTRESLKAWAGSAVVYSQGGMETKDYIKMANNITGATSPTGYARNGLIPFIETTTDATLKNCRSRDS